MRNPIAHLQAVPRKRKMHMQRQSRLRNGDPGRIYWPGSSRTRFAMGQRHRFAARLRLATLIFPAFIPPLVVAAEMRAGDVDQTLWKNLDILYPSLEPYCPGVEKGFNTVK